MADALTRLWDAHRGALVRVVATYASTRPDRDDLLQDILLAIHKALPRFRGDASVRTFILRIAHNRGASWLVRKNAAAPNAAAWTEPVDGAATPEQRAAEQQAVRHLMEALRNLPLAQRQALALVLEGLSHREVADVLNISENAVAARIHRARQALRTELGRSHG